MMGEYAVSAQRGRLCPVVLGFAFAQLPGAVRLAHESASLMRGTVTVERGTSLLSRVAGFFAGMPKACMHGPCEVRFEQLHNGERWVRDMNGSRFVSTLTAAAEPACFDESFGWYGFRFRIDADEGSAHFSLVRHTVCGIPVPKLFWPQVRTVESEVNGSYRFEVEARMANGELLVRYVGALAPVEG